MNRNRLLVIGVVALLAAAAISWIILTSVRRSLAMATVSADARIVVAAHDLTVGQKLADSDVRVVPMPGANLPHGAFHMSEDVIGRGVVLPIQANEVVLGSKLADPEAGASLPSIIPPGMRAVSVKVNDVVAVAGFVVPGTHVDVIVTGKPASSSDSANVTTTTVLQNVPVLAAGKKLQHDSEGKPQDVPVITLLVSPADAQLLTLASAEGRIQLALRNPTDTEKQHTAAVRNAALYGLEKPVSAPAPRARARVVQATKAPEQAAGEYKVEVIRGAKRETTKFEGEEAKQ
jgi:pilus assembly protein CpaB